MNYIKTNKEYNIINSFIHFTKVFSIKPQHHILLLYIKLRIKTTEQNKKIRESLDGSPNRILI